MFNIKVDKQDQLFSKMIRERDAQCVFCGKGSDWQLQNSHFWGRGHKATRFDPENCDALCFTCHMSNEGNKQGFYRTWKLSQLGKKRYEALEARHYQTKKYGAYEKPLLFKILKEQYSTGEHLKPKWSVVW
jgi:hypothetical protein